MKGPNEAQPICTYLEWDSHFFGKQIARLNRSRLEAATLAESLAWCTKNRIDCLYFLADADDPATLFLAAENQFLFVDIRVTLEKKIESEKTAESTQGVRFAEENDLPTLRAIARTAHRDSRFYFDPNFERSKCDLLYETWIENSFRGFAHAVLIAEITGRPSAYLTCHVNGSESQIGLVGVGESDRGQGLAGKLVERFRFWSAEQGAARAIVVTQGRNVHAQRLYQRHGYVTRSMQLWYHRWFPH